MTTAYVVVEALTVRRRSDDLHKLGFGVQPPAYDMSNPRLWRSSRCRRIVVMSSSAVVMPSAHCRRAVVSIVISTRRDFHIPLAHVFWIMLSQRWASSNAREDLLWALKTLREHSFWAGFHILLEGWCAWSARSDDHVLGMEFLPVA